MNRDNHQTRKDKERQRHINQALAALEKALSRCREEDVRYTTGAIASLSFLERLTDEKWPFDQFREAMAAAGMDGTKLEARWQSLNAALTGIKRGLDGELRARRKLPPGTLLGVGG